MSELYAKIQITNDTRLVYLKSEADKVIAEKDKEIAELKQEIEQLKKENEMVLVGVNLRSPTSDGRFI